MEDVKVATEVLQERRSLGGLERIIGVQTLVDLKEKTHE